MLDYIDRFPLEIKDIPQQLKELLSPISNQYPEEDILVNVRIQIDPHGMNQEYVHMVMASVPEDEASSINSKLRLSCNGGVVSSSIPDCESKGALKEWYPSISGYDYIIASWSDGSFYSYALAEKVWMLLGLSARVIGGADQTIIYDDLSLPIMSVAKGEVSSAYYWQQSRNVRWTMRNDYLRKYLWKRGHVGIRAFFYEKMIEDTPAIRKIMEDKKHFTKTLEDGWCEIDIREYKGNLLLQVWASVIAILPEKCEEIDIYSLIWDKNEGILPKREVESIFNERDVYVKDTFLEKYEKNTLYDSTSIMEGKVCWCCPSYLGMWSFEECKRIGRNLVVIPLRSLYKAIPEEEILHVYNHKLSKNEITTFNLEEEHIVSKIHRLLKQLIYLGENLSKLFNHVTSKSIEPSDLIEYTLEEFKNEGIRNYPLISKLSQVAPLKMYEQDFLSRCKTLHEVISNIKTSYLKKILIECGCDKSKIGKLGSLKLLQILVNILESLNNNHENIYALKNSAEYTDWSARNSNLAALFINNDLRQSYAHEKIGKTVEILEQIGFDSKKVNNGYGAALDFIFDEVIIAIKLINSNVINILER